MTRYAGLAAIVLALATAPARADTSAAGTLMDLPSAPSVTPSPPPRPRLTDKSLGGPDTKARSDGTKWDFKKDSTFVLGDGTKRPKGPALKAR